MMVADGGRLFSKVAVVVRPLAFIVVVFTEAVSTGVKHTVGDSIWSIPPTHDLYSNWSSSRTFHTGDVLFFDFESEMYNVMRVHEWEYEYCDMNLGFPSQRFTDGPASVPLTKEGTFYYMCTMLNYCSLGLRLEVTVKPPALLHGDGEAS